MGSFSTFSDTNDKQKNKCDIIIGFLSFSFHSEFWLQILDFGAYSQIENLNAKIPFKLKIVRRKWIFRSFEINKRKVHSLQIV